MFITHTQCSGDGVAVSNEVYFEMDVRGLPSWFDMRIPPSRPWRRVCKKSSCCVAVITGPCVNPDRPDDKPEDNAYFKRASRLKEL